MSTIRQGRAYDGSGRRAQAEQTRERILTEARGLFIEQGFAGTSVADVAAAAGVSVPTVFSAFGSKVNLLKEAAETTMVGDTEPIPMAQRPAMQHVRAGTTAEEVLDRFADLVAARAGEIYPIYSVIYRGRDSHPEIAAMAEVLDDQRLRGAAALAEIVVARSGRDDPDLVATVRDGLWAVMSLEWYETLVIRRRWPVGRYRGWLRALMEIPLTSCLP